MKHKVEQVDENELFDDRVEVAYNKWDEWVLENPELEVLTTGGWESDDDNILCMPYSHVDVVDDYHSTHNEEVEETIIDSKLCIKFKKGTTEVIKVYIKDE